MPVRTFVRRTLPLTGDNGRLLKNVLSSASGAVDKVAYYIPPRDATAFLRKASSRCLGCVGRIARGWARKANCEPARNRGIVIDTGRRGCRQVGDARAAIRAPGSVIVHQSGAPHAMTTGAESMLALFTWRGDLATSPAYV
jgi:hypothetical protein